MKAILPGAQVSLRSECMLPERSEGPLLHSGEFARQQRDSHWHYAGLASTARHTVPVSRRSLAPHCVWCSAGVAGMHAILPGAQVSLRSECTCPERSEGFLRWQSYEKAEVGILRCAQNTCTLNEVKGFYSAQENSRDSEGILRCAQKAGGPNSNLLNWSLSLYRGKNGEHTLKRYDKQHWPARGSKDQHKPSSLPFHFTYRGRANTQGSHKMHPLLGCLSVDLNGRMKGATDAKSNLARNPAC
jgi:hypothetical protein